MLHGSCFCKKVKIEYSGQSPTVVSDFLFILIISYITVLYMLRHDLTEPQALCHCGDCRKLSGSPYTLNFLVKSSELKVTGSPTPGAKVADGGKKYKNYFCPDCGK